MRDSSPNLSFPAAASADVEALWPFRYHFFFVKVFTVSYTFDHILWVFRVAGKVVEVFLFCTAVSCSFIAPAHFHRQHKTINTNEIFLPLSMTHQKQSTITYAWLDKPPHTQTKKSYGSFLPSKEYLSIPSLTEISKSLCLFQITTSNGSINDQNRFRHVAVAVGHVALVLQGL